MLDLTDALFVSSLFDVFVLAVTRGERKATVGMTVGVEDTDVN